MLFLEKGIANEMLLFLGKLGASHILSGRVVASIF